jgi:hypothetical protein
VPRSTREDALWDMVSLFSYVCVVLCMWGGARPSACFSVVRFDDEFKQSLRGYAPFKLEWQGVAPYDDMLFALHIFPPPPLS